MCIALPDSGCGISRPSSQTDTVDMRVHRAESIGKKSVQSVVSDLGVVSDDNNKQSFCKEVIMEGKENIVCMQTNFLGKVFY